MASVQQGPLSCSHRDGSRITELLSLTARGHAGQQPPDQSLSQLHSTATRSGCQSLQRAFLLWFPMPGLFMSLLTLASCSIAIFQI